jgi:DNA helicase HerA-like ATPase
MQEIDLSGKHFLTLGKKNTGKSYFNNWLMSQTSDPYVVFDPMREHTDYRDTDVVIHPTETRGEAANRQLRDVLDWVRDNRQHLGYIWIDEVNRFHSKGGTLDGPLGQLVDLSAHYGLGAGFIARRPVQVHTDLRELADYTFIFRLNGISDIRTLDDMARGLGERAADLDPREFLILYPDGSYKTHSPIGDRIQHEKGV